MCDMEWFQCGYLPRRGDDDAMGGADDLRACTLTSCFPRNAGEDDEEKPALVRVYPGGWGFAVGSSADGAVWTWGACREYLEEGVAGDGRPRRGAGRAHPASAGFATVVSCARETDERIEIDDARSSEVRVRVEGWRPGPPADDRAPHTVTFFAARNTPPTRLRPGSRLNTHRMPATRRARHLAAGDEHFLLVTDAGEAFRGEFRGEFRGGARVAALVFDAGAPGSGSDGTIPRDVKITHVAAGSRHSALVDADGRVWTFGWGLYGQLGHETCEDASDPKPVAALGACFARAVAAGAAHTSVLVSTGGVYAFGSNQDGQLGVPPSACALGAATATPALVEFSWDDERRVDAVERASAAPCTSVSAVSCGARHTACVTSFGDLVTWGWNAYGQLGVRDRETRAAPTRVTAPNFTREGKKKARAVACGRWHTVVAYGDDGTAS